MKNQKEVFSDQPMALNENIEQLTAGSRLISVTPLKLALDPVISEPFLCVPHSSPGPTYPPNTILAICFRVEVAARVP